jgi:hypothetical protein
MNDILCNTRNCNVVGNTTEFIICVFSFLSAYVCPLYICLSKNCVACRCKFISYLLVFADFISASCSMCIIH